MTASMESETVTRLLDLEVQWSKAVDIWHAFHGPSECFGDKDERVWVCQVPVLQAIIRGCFSSEGTKAAFMAILASSLPFILDGDASSMVASLLPHVEEQLESFLRWFQNQGLPNKEEALQAMQYRVLLLPEVRDYMFSAWFVLLREHLVKCMKSAWETARHGIVALRQMKAMSKQRVLEAWDNAEVGRSDVRRRVLCRLCDAIKLSEEFPNTVARVELIAAKRPCDDRASNMVDFLNSPPSKFKRKRSPDPPEPVERATERATVRATDVPTRRYRELALAVIAVAPDRTVTDSSGRSVSSRDFYALCSLEIDAPALQAAYRLRYAHTNRRRRWIVVPDTEFHGTHLSTANGGDKFVRVELCKMCRALVEADDVLEHVHTLAFPVRRADGGYLTAIVTGLDVTGSEEPGVVVVDHADDRDFAIRVGRDFATLAATITDKTIDMPTAISQSAPTDAAFAAFAPMVVIDALMNDEQLPITYESAAGTYVAKVASGVALQNLAIPETDKRAWWSCVKTARQVLLHGSDARDSDGRVDALTREIDADRDFA